MNEYILAIQEMANDKLVHLFIIVILLDIFTGVCKAYSKGNIYSNTGLKGLLKHIMNIVVVIVLYPYLEMLGLSKYGEIIIVFYLSFYGISIIENLDKLGVPFPKFIKQRLEMLHEKTNEKEEEK